MATFKQLDPQDIKTTKSTLNQLIDISGEDISGSAVNTRRKYVHWASGSYSYKSDWNTYTTSDITSSLWQTIYDQDYTVATANPLFDATVGLYATSSIVTDLSPTVDSDGLYVFPSTTAQMREKMYIYKQYAQVMLGDQTSRFTAPLNSTTTSDNIDEALFVSFKRLFSRDGFKRETIYLRSAYSASHDSIDTPEYYNMFRTGSTFRVYSDVDSNDNKLVTAGGNVSNIYQSNDTTNCVGLAFLDQGVCVYDLAKIFQPDQPITGVFSLQDSSSTLCEFTGAFVSGTMSGETTLGKNYFLASASIDNILDHVLSSRIANSTDSQISFQNKTNLNSTLFFCKIDADEFNYSSNPTYVDDDQDIVVIGDDSNEKSFAYATSIALCNSSNETMAVAKLSRPVFINDERALTLRIRLDH
jgi:hypothetical protein